MSSLFGGTFLYWFFLLFLIAVLTMRLFAAPGEGPERRSARELLLSVGAPRGSDRPGQAPGSQPALCPAVGTDRAAAPVAAARGRRGSADPASSALCGYLGVFLTGQSALAFGLLASVIAPTQLIAATLTFVLLSLLLLSGLVVDAYSVDPGCGCAVVRPSVSPHGRAGPRHRRQPTPALPRQPNRAVLAGCDDPPAPDPAIGGAGICAAVVADSAVRLRRPQRPRQSASAARRSQSDREHALSPELLSTLQTLPRPVRLTVLSGDSEGLARDELEGRLHETLVRAEQAAPTRIAVRYLDLDRQREEVACSPSVITSIAMSCAWACSSSRAASPDTSAAWPSRAIAWASYGVTRALPSHIFALSRRSGAASGPARRRQSAHPSLCFTRGHGESGTTASPAQAAASYRCS